MKIKDDFISPLSDFAFKRIFGDQRNIDITAAFLKTLLDIPEDEYDKLTVTNPILGGLFKYGKTPIVDLKLETKSGKIIHIELQLEKKKNLIGRILYYTVRLIADQLGWGEDYGKLHQVISIIICDHKLLKGEDSYINIFELRNSRNFLFTNLLKIVILELPKLTETEDNAVWRWLRFLKCEKKEDYEMLAAKYPELEKPIIHARRLTLLEHWRNYWFDRHIAKMDERMILETWKEDGREEGLAEGKLEIAKKLLAEGATHEFIQRITGIDLRKQSESGLNS